MFAKIGYGQVEPNRVAAQYTKQIVADVPVAVADFETMGEVVENGVFLTWNPGEGIDNNLKKGQLELPVKGGSEMTLLIYSEVKRYHESQGNKDFAITTTKHNLLSGLNQSPYRDNVNPDAPHNTVVPRGYFPTVGDVYTTNLLKVADPKEGDLLTPGTDGILDTATGTEFLVYRVAQITTMADRQKAVKLVCIKANK